MKLLLILVVFTMAGFAQMRQTTLAPSDFDSASMPHLRILDAKVISFGKLKGLAFTEISGLAYDGEKEMLYAISDHGILYHLKLGLAEKTINTLELLDAYAITDTQGKPYGKSKRDSEGLALFDGGLLISFEQKPRVLFCDLQGRKIRKMAIADALGDIENYQSKNSALEAVTYHKKYGVITAPERPLGKNSEKEHVLYAKERTWRFRASASITALEVMEDGNLLVLERGFNPFLMQREIVLKKVLLGKCKEEACAYELLARLESAKGWKLDNFEGLTHIKENLYLMVSDDNDSLLQDTILVLFEII